MRVGLASDWLSPCRCLFECDEVLRIGSSRMRDNDDAMQLTLDLDQAQHPLSLRSCMGQSNTHSTGSERCMRTGLLNARSVTPPAYSLIL